MTPSDTPSALPPGSNGGNGNNVSQGEAVTRVQPAVVIKIDQEANIGSFVETHVIDVNAEGIFLRSANPREVGTPVKLMIPWPGGRNHCEIPGKVESTVPEGPRPGMQIKLATRDPIQKMMLGKIIKTHQRLRNSG